MLVSTACFPEVHEKLTKSQKARFSARTRYTNSSSFTSLDEGSSEGVYGGSPGGQAFAVHSPQNATA
ncbi:Phenylalanine--tRNA ligase beta subunit [Labeo rohita]|uniref:Phenylalanine--tRNA ligase beta subunit n=1 Tax=Labeo rohita TaxID=84645 RepID=A0ABQ8LPB6_LABRO|nr:Phenylalanine--tRNA ligase beta subunit [Labeo rohita]